MIVVEGMDGSGKTTLATAISGNFQIPLHHSGGPPKTLDEVNNCLARCETRMTQRCVQDRITHISESVYGMLYRHEMAGAALAALRHVSRASLVVYCRPTVGTILDNLATTHEVKAHETAEHVEQVKSKAVYLIEIYDTVIAAVSNMTKVFYYDYTKSGEINRVMRIVENYARKR